MFTVCDDKVDFNLSRHLIPFLANNPFYSELSRHIHKHFTFDIPTAAVCYDKSADELVLFVNPTFMTGGEWVSPHDKKKRVRKMERLTNWEIQGVIEHELDHIVFGHLSARVREPSDGWNIATDCGIDSLIVKSAEMPRDLKPGEVARPLPRCALVPGQRPWIDPEIFDTLPKWQQEATNELADFIVGLPPLMSSEYYFNEYLKMQSNSKSKRKGKKPGKGGKGKGSPGNDGDPGKGDPGPGGEEQSDDGGEGDAGSGGDIYVAIPSMDDHSAWKNITEEEREYIEGKRKSLVEKAVRHADSQTEGWGSIPMDIREQIRRSVSNIVDWRGVLRQFVGMLVRGTRTTSIKRINRRYPYIHPGLKRGYVAKLIVAIDMSGSVGNEMLEMFFAELTQLTKKVDISILPFDCSCSDKDIFEWKKGTNPLLTRVKSGGTNFDAPTKVVNSTKNRGRWDGMLIMTDGQAPAPESSRVRRGWVLGQGCNLHFPSNEIQIFLSKERPMTGAWR